MTKVKENPVLSNHQIAIIEALKQDRVLHQVFTPFFEEYSIYDLHKTVYHYAFISMEYAPECFIILSELTQDTIAIMADLNDIEEILYKSHQEVVKDMVKIDNRLRVLKALDTALLKVNAANPAYRKTLTAWRNIYFIYCSTINGWNLSEYEI